MFAGGQYWFDTSESGTVTLDDTLARIVEVDSSAITTVFKTKAFLKLTNVKFYGSYAEVNFTVHSGSVNGLADQKTYGLLFPGLIP